MNPDVFLELAQEFEQRTLAPNAALVHEVRTPYACVALAERKAFDELAFYTTVFKPENTQRLAWMNELWIEDNDDSTFDHRAYYRDVDNVRILMLCFAYHLSQEPECIA